MMVQRRPALGSALGPASRIGLVLLMFIGTGAVFAAASVAQETGLHRLGNLR